MADQEEPCLRHEVIAVKKLFLVKVATDLRIQRLVKRPFEIIFPTERGFEVIVIPRRSVSCDVCNRGVAAHEGALDVLPPGYVICDEERLYDVLCEECANKTGLPRFNTLEEAEGNG